MRLGSGGTWLAIAALCALLSSPVAGAEEARQSIAGTMVSLVPPIGYVPARGFSGLSNEVTGGGIVVTESPAGAFAAVAADANVDRLNRIFEPGGTVIDDAIMTKVAGRPALMMHAHGQIDGAPYRKWVTFIGAERSIMLLVQVPERHMLAEDAVIGVLASVQLSREPTLEEKIALLPFRMAVTQPFRPVAEFLETAVSLTIGPADVFTAATQPSLVISYQSTPLPPSMPPDAYALKAIRAHPNYRVAKVIASTLTGEPGAQMVETVAEGADAKSGKAVRIFQRIHFSPTGLLLVLGEARPEGWDALVDEMRAVDDGITVKTAAASR